MRKTASSGSTDRAAKAGRRPAVSPEGKGLASAGPSLPEEYYRLIFAHAPVGVFHFDERGFVTGCNDRFAGILGGVAEEIVGFNILSDLKDERMRSAAESCIEGDVGRFEGEYISVITGRRLAVSVTFGPMLSLDGKVTGGIGIFEDIGARVRAEKELRERESLLDAVINTEPECVKMLDAEGRLLMMNPAGLSMIQAESLEQVKGQCVYPLVAPEYRDAFRNLTEDVFDGKQGTLLFELIGLKGRRTWLETRAVPFMQEDRVSCLLGVTRDVTEHKRVLETLRSSEREFKNLFDSSPVSLWLEDLSAVKNHMEKLRESGIEDLAAHVAAHPEIVPATLAMARILDVNKATIDLYGAAGKEELLRDLGATFTEKSLEGFADGLLALAEGRTQFQTEVETVTLRGNRLHTQVNWSVVPGHERDYSRVVVSIVDLTERRKGEMLFRMAGEGLGGTTGEEYFRALVAALAESLGTAVAFVGEKLPGTNRVLTRAVTVDGRPAPNFEYERRGTPCEKVVGDSPCFYPEHVRRLFPRDALLREKGIESFAAIPLLSSTGERLGLLAVCHTGTMARDAESHVLSVLRLFGSRAASEMERMRTEHDLRESQARLSAAQVMAHVGDWDWDVPSGRVSWSDEVFRIYGYEPGEVAPDYDLVLRAMDAEDKTLFLENIEAALKGERPFEMDYAFYTTGGAKKTVHTIGKVFRDDQGAAMRMVGTVQDITDRVQAEAALKESEERFRMLFESSPDAGLLADVESGRIIDANSAACALLERERERIIGMRQTELHPPESVESYAKAFRDHVGESGNGGSSAPLEALVLRSDGARVPVEIVARRITLRGRPVLYGVFRNISGRMKAEKALRESEERYRELFENASDPIFILDATHRYVDVNRRATEVFGFTREEFLAMSVFDVIPDEQKIRSRETFSVLKNRGVYERFEGKMRARDGRWRDIEVSSSAIMKDGVFLGSRDIVRDITPEKEARELVRCSRDMLSRAEEIAKLGSWEWDVGSNALVWSDEVYRIYGFDPRKDAPTYERVIETVHPAYRETFLRDVEEALETGRPLDGEYALVRPDGKVRFTHAKAEVLRDEGGKAVRMVGTVQDVTERKRSETFIRDILETVDEAFLIVGPDYSIMSANRAYAEQAGLPMKDIVGRKCHEISHGSARPCFENGEDCGVRTVFETGREAVALHVHHDAEGNEIFVETKAFPMKDPSGRVTAAIEIVNNITEKKKLEEQLRHAQKLEAVALLAGGVAHDFNNLLTAISGYGNLLSMKLPFDDPLQSYVDQIMGASDRAATLTQGLLAFSRKQILRPEPVDLNEIVGEMDKLLQRVIGEDVEVAMELAPGGCWVRTDRGQTEQILMNLATNARDAMPQGGLLTIRTEHAVIDEHFRKKHGFGTDGEYGCMKVSDTGAGMDEKTRERIFEPFFTTKELGRGTGLGLSTVYGIVRQAEGFVTVDSTPGEGTVFSVFLPVTREAAKKPRADEEFTHRHGRETVLVAEDEPILRRLMNDVLSQFGYSVIVAADGEEAVARFAENRDRVDLLVLDVIMPKKNGKEAYAAIRRMRPDVKTLFISGYSSDILDPMSLQNEGCHLVSKPVSPPFFLKKIRDILDGR